MAWLLGVDKRTVIEDIEFEEQDADDVALVVARGAATKRCCTTMWPVSAQGTLV